MPYFFAVPAITSSTPLARPPEEMILAICELFRMHRDVVVEDVRRTLEDFDRAGLVSWDR